MHAPRRTRGTRPRSARSAASAAAAMDGSSARFRNMTVWPSAPLRFHGASELVGGVVRDADRREHDGEARRCCPRRAGARAARSARRAGRAAGRSPEKSGSFWPRTRLFITSMVAMPVSMKSRGRARARGIDRDSRRCASVRVPRRAGRRRSAGRRCRRRVPAGPDRRRTRAARDASGRACPRARGRVSIRAPRSPSSSRRSRRRGRGAACRPGQALRPPSCRPDAHDPSHEEQRAGDPGHGVREVRAAALHGGPRVPLARSRTSIVASTGAAAARRPRRSPPRGAQSPQHRQRREPLERDARGDERPRRDP